MIIFFSKQKTDSLEKLISCDLKYIILTEMSNLRLF